MVKTTSREWILFDCAPVFILPNNIQQFFRALQLCRYTSKTQVLQHVMKQTATQYLDALIIITTKLFWQVSFGQKIMQSYLIK